MHKSTCDLILQKLINRSALDNIHEPVEVLDVIFHTRITQDINSSLRDCIAELMGGEIATLQQVALIGKETGRIYFFSRKIIGV